MLIWGSCTQNTTPMSECGVSALTQVADTPMMWINVLWFWAAWQTM
jgi:hypothetical protein